MADRIKRLLIGTAQGEAGMLFRESQFVFRYRDEALNHPEVAISLTMPPRPEAYSTNQLTPVLAMNLPEGFLRDRIMERYGKTFDITDDMNLLALTSTRAAGRVWAHDGQQKKATPAAVNLKELLATRGTEELFDQLVEEFATSTMISGVQPKIVAPMAEGMVGRTIVERPAIKSPELIIKAAGAEFSSLPENEFYCMSMAKAAGIEVPDFWLSEDRSLFVIRRFDLRDDGSFLGFEDIASLTGRHPSKKYVGTYAMVAQVISDFSSRDRRVHSLDQFFRQLVLCCLVENGDAHLKNWGILYGDPVSAATDSRLSPAFDIVCTTAYLPKDRLALSLNGTRSWPDRSSLEQFGRNQCAVAEPGEVIDEVLDAALSFRPDEKTEMWKLILGVLERQHPALKSERVTARSRLT